MILNGTLEPILERSHEILLVGWDNSGRVCSFYHRMPRSNTYALSGVKGTLVPFVVCGGQLLRMDDLRGSFGHINPSIITRLEEMRDVG